MGKLRTLAEILLAVILFFAVLVLILTAVGKANDDFHGTLAAYSILGALFTIALALWGLMILLVRGGTGLTNRPHMGAFLAFAAFTMWWLAAAWGIWTFYLAKDDGRWYRFVGNSSLEGQNPNYINDGSPLFDRSEEVEETNTNTNTNSKRQFNTFAPTGETVAPGVTQTVPGVTQTVPVATIIVVPVATTVVPRIRTVRQFGLGGPSKGAFALTLLLWPLFVALFGLLGYKAMKSYGKYRKAIAPGPVPAAVAPGVAGYPPASFGPANPNVIPSGGGVYGGGQPLPNLGADHTTQVAPNVRV